MDEGQPAGDTVPSVPAPVHAVPSVPASAGDAVPSVSAPPPGDAVPSVSAPPGDAVASPEPARPNVVPLLNSCLLQHVIDVNNIPCLTC